MARSISREQLLGEGGEDCVVSTVEIYFLLPLNSAQVNLVTLEEDPPAKVHLELIENIITHAYACMNEDHLKPGYQWQSSPAQEAKLYYRGVLALRLAGDPFTAKDALGLSSRARDRLDDDANITREQDMVLGWCPLTIVWPCLGFLSQCRCVSKQYSSQDLDLFGALSA